MNKRAAIPCAALLLLAVACGDSVTGPSCTNIAGSWQGSFANSCGGNASGQATIAQDGCSFSTFVGQDEISGSIDGQRFDFEVNGPCGSSDGTGTISGNTITGTYEGQSNGIGNCCPAGRTTGSFSLTR